MVELVSLLGFLAVGVAAAFLARRSRRKPRWHEHQSRHEMTDAQRSLSERRW